MPEPAETLGDVSWRRGGSVGELLAELEVPGHLRPPAYLVGELLNIDSALPGYQIFEPLHPSHAESRSTAKTSRPRRTEAVTKGSLRQGE
jgi:hypothetical protein